MYVSCKVAIANLKKFKGAKVKLRRMISWVLKKIFKISTGS